MTGSKKFFLIALSCLLWLIPLPYGGVEEWSIFALEAAIILLFIIFVLLPILPVYSEGRLARRSSRISEFPGREKRIESRIVLALILTFLAINLWQLIPLPAALVKIFSPRKYHLLAAALALATDAGTELPAPASFPSLLPLSLVPALTYYELIKYICFFLFAIMLYRSLDSRRQIQWLILVLLSAGIFQAIYGLAEYLSGTGRIFGYKNIWGQGSAFGTFINRDHYAGFLEMIFPLSLGFLLARSNFFALKKGVNWRQKIVWFSQERLQQAILFGTLSVIVGLGLFFSRSRSGVIIFFLIFFLMLLAISLGAKEGQKEGQREKGQRGHGLALSQRSGRRDRKEGDEQRNEGEMNEGERNGSESNEVERTEGEKNEGSGNEGVRNKDKRNEDKSNKGGWIQGEKNGGEWNKMENPESIRVRYEWSKETKRKAVENGYEWNPGERNEGQKNGGKGNDSERSKGLWKSSKGVRNGDRPGKVNDPGSRRWLRVIRTVTLAVIFVAIFIGIRPIIERFTLESLWREARPRFYGLTLRLIADYALFGTGAGTYIYAYTPYEEEDLGGILHHAHNDYLETLAEMGLIGGGAIIIAAFLALAILFWRWVKLPEHDYFGRGVGLGFLGGIVAILIHSFSDFNLRLPANALYFISFYVLAWRLLVARIDER